MTRDWMEKRKLEEVKDDAQQPSASNGLANRSVIVSARSPELHYQGKTGICYDVRMRYHQRLNIDPDNYLDPHPEDPRRTFRIYKTLAENGLLIDEYLKGTDDLGVLMEKIYAREASQDQLLLVHSQEHLNFIASVEKMSTDELVKETETGDSIYVNNDSYLTAKLSCGGAIECCRAVVEHRVKNSLAVIRPPGHHAEPDAPGGFCLFSNVAVAAKVMLRDYPEQVKRIAILDWDVHHGNGTQKSFIDDPRVLYISLHRYQNGSFYPGTKAGGPGVVGTGAGEGFNVNIPWNSKDMTDGDYITAMHRIILPICDEFNPDLCIISSGFDAAEGDPIGCCHVSPEGYAYMTHMMKMLCDGKLVVCLEGGYNLDSISISALAVAKVLLGDPPGHPKVTKASASALRTIDEVIRIQSRYWKCLGPSHPVPEPDVSFAPPYLKSLYEVLRTYELSHLSEKYSFSELPFSSKGSGIIRNQVLASPNVYHSEKLLVILHDSPLVWAAKDLTTGLVGPSESTVACLNERYIEWALKNNYAVVDINAADELTHEDATDVQTLMTTVWDNSIRHFDATNIAFVAIGNCYGGVVHLAGHRELRRKCEALIAFVSNDSLRQIVPALDENVVDWFYRTSLIFTNHSHKCWDNVSNGSGTKRPRKRMGRVIRSDSENLYDMIDEKFQESVEFILDE